MRTFTLVTQHGCQQLNCDELMRFSAVPVTAGAITNGRV